MINLKELAERDSISISMMKETSNSAKQCVDGSCPSEAYGGGWEGLGEDRGEPAP
jgi:hypothetical protein